LAERITPSVDSYVAAICRSVSEDDRRRSDLLINLRLLDATDPGKPLQETMLEISRNAQQRGLTPNFLRDPCRRMNRIVFDTNVIVNALLFSENERF
jgi:hypothetical protein